MDRSGVDRRRYLHTQRREPRNRYKTMNNKRLKLRVWLLCGTRFIFYPTPGNPYGVEMVAEKYESDGTLLCWGTGHEAHHVYFVTPEQLAQPELFKILG